MSTKAWQYQWRLFVRNKGAVIGLVLLALWIVVVIFAHVVAPYDPLLTESDARLAPSGQFWFGTDRLGRDMLSRVLYGGRISLLLGVISVVIGGVAGILLGLAAGYYGRWVDVVIMRLMDAMLAFPGMLLALIIIATLGPSIRNVMLAVGFSTIPQYARLTRGSVLAVRTLPYVEAARIIGGRGWRVMFRRCKSAMQFWSGQG
jgi:peptide/nickel transport system permease protein